MTLRWTTVDSPIDELLLVADDDGLTQVAFTPFTPPSGERADDDPVLAGAGQQLTEYFAGQQLTEYFAGQQLTEYFAGQRHDFDLPLAASGTQFRRLVWDQLRAIPYGATTTYGAIARTLGLTGHGARAVGVANGANPIAVVMPCHRVVGSDGQLTGYAGGLDRKRALLALERSALC